MSVPKGLKNGSKEAIDDQTRLDTPMKEKAHLYRVLQGMASKSLALNGLNCKGVSILNVCGK